MIVAGRRATGRALALLLALAVLASACSGGGSSDDAPDASTTRAATTSGSPVPSTDPADPTDPDDADPSAPDVAPIAWEDCADGLECATVVVPLDHDEPDGATIDLAVARRPATGDRLGALFVNPGGPGASAVEFAETVALPAQLTERFDIVGVDPRGVGGSTPLECNDRLAAMYDADPTFEDEADVDAYLEVSQAYVDDCEAAGGDLLAHLGTEDVARDHDLVRAAMGDDQLSFLGLSYGTSLGQTYARLFPTHVRAMVLDGIVALGGDALADAATQAAGFETALTAFEEDCDARSCLDRPAGEVVDDLIAEVEDTPIPAADRPAGPGVVQLALTRALYAESLWPALARALAAAEAGDGDGLVALADAFLGRRDDGSYGHDFEAYFATGCVDGNFPRDPDVVLEAAAEAGRDAPTFGEALVADYVRCALWPVPSAPLVPVPADLQGLPPTLVISTTRDSATPYEAGVAVADQIPGAVLLTNDGDGHTALLTGKPCVTDAVVAYLLDPADALADDLTCA